MEINVALIILLMVESKIMDACVVVLVCKLRTLFFVSRLLGLVYASDNKENIEHERVQFWGTTEHKRGLRVRHTVH